MPALVRCDCRSHGCKGAYVQPSTKRTHERKDLRMQTGEVRALPGREDPTCLHAIQTGVLLASYVQCNGQVAGASSSVDYEFATSARAGAILLLPQCAMSVKLVSPEQFRAEAMKSALNCDVTSIVLSMYLITGFYKARSWSLGSFNNPTGTTGRILARQNDKDPNVYPLVFEFPADLHDGGSSSGNFNQTILSHWFQDYGQHSSVQGLSRLVTRFFGWAQAAYGYTEHKPELSQPFHPSDIINRFLLDKNPDDRVAITHDDDWMYTMKDLGIKIFFTKTALAHS
ncbi:hypothetical protein L210DRAFT_3656570 [Boletus edulis BED1]|uniref:Uncharacterized protein n=1 Tax=Boletus edulis BED1 TaxID=1328754 RepID=A0AAD4G632_BOLED|nr:hypothetical protein L210DRAFT_3656570 [Boletus edulis BED1]